VAEKWGGGGGTLLDLAVVFEEAGRALLAAPLLATVAAARLVERTGDDEARKHLLPPWLDGTARVALVVAPDAVVRPDGHGVVLDGRVELVADAADADALVIAAPGSIAVVPTGAPGLTRSARAGFAGDAQVDVSLA